MFKDRNFAMVLLRFIYIYSLTTLLDGSLLVLSDGVVGSLSKAQDFGSY